MADVTADVGVAPRPNLDQGMNIGSLAVFGGLLAIGLLFTAYSIYSGISATGAPTRTILPFLLLGVALLIALGFEFVNGFHDTANAVATVIYTHSLPPNFAVVWSGSWNFIGVLTSTGAVAFGIVSLLPVELILQVGSDAGFAMVFALLIAAIAWNLGTGPISSCIWGKAPPAWIGRRRLRSATLLVSPIVGFVFSALFLLVAKLVIRSPALYKAPEGRQQPPLWIRGLLVLTCTGVSFAHGSNDGQKGMGLIMLILIGTVPTAYALNRALPQEAVAQFATIAQTTQDSLTKMTNGAGRSQGGAAGIHPHPPIE
jgi:PiT family inorganic phosphate transporter